MNFLTGFSVCCVLGIFVDGITEDIEPSKVYHLVMFAIIFFIIFLGIAICIINHDVESNFIWAFLAISISIILIELRLHKKIMVKYFYAIIILILVLDSMGNNLLSMRFEPYDSVKQEDALALRLLPKDAHSYRIYSPAFSLSQLSASINELQMINGISPMQLKSVSDYISHATGVPNESYSVTLPALATGTPELDNAGFHPDAKLLGLLSTKYVISQFPLEEPGLSLLKSSDYLWLYENEYVLPFAWVIPSADTTIIDRTPNRISISTSGPGQLVLSEVIYPGWVAAMDGTPAPIATYQGLLRSVDVPAGRHEIIFHISLNHYGSEWRSQQSRFLLCWDIHL